MWKCRSRCLHRPVRGTGPTLSCFVVAESHNGLYEKMYCWSI